MSKRVSIGPSLAYGLRLTLRHWRSLVPGSAAFYLPELLRRFGTGFVGGQAGVTVWKFILGCWLLWHALRLSDLETRSSRLHETRPDSAPSEGRRAQGREPGGAALPAPGYLARFLASTLLFWGGLGLLLWPSLRLLSGAWLPSARALAWLGQPRLWGASQGELALGAALLALPAGLWSVYGWFHGYYVADEGQGAWASMLSSFGAVRGAFWSCLAFLAAIAAINALGLALWTVGIFFAFPVTLMATTYVHLELKAQAAPERLGA